MIKVAHLSKAFFHKIALKDVSFELAKGKTTALLGHNGAGKSTLIKILLGLVKADKGSITIENRSILSEDLKSIGYMPEISTLPLELTPLELLSYKQSLQKKINLAASVISQLHECGLWQVRNKKIKELSRGLKQRLSWALCGLSDPELFILDEPFSGLDPIGMQSFISWLDLQKSKQKTIFLCCHEIETALQSSSNLLILQRGAICFNAANHKIKTRAEILHYFQGEVTDSL